MGSEEGTTNDKSLFGLVRWQSVRVVPLDWLEDGHNLQYEKLPVRCRCKWGPADQVVELIEISGKLEAVHRDGFARSRPGETRTRRAESHGDTPRPILACLQPCVCVCV